MNVSRSSVVRSPRDGRVLAEIQHSTPSEVEGALWDLRSAQTSWEALGVRARSHALAAFRDRLAVRRDDLADLVAAETGKPLVEAHVEVAFVIDMLGTYSRKSPKWFRERRVRPTLMSRHKSLSIWHSPYPVVGVITPWNFPLGLALLDAVPALAAGASVLIKPAEQTPLAVREAVRIWDEAVPSHPVLKALTGGPEVGAAVCEGVDYVQFTGSTRTGRMVAEAAARSLKPYGLELGGKDPMIVLADADLERAARAAVFGAMCNAGQMCTSVERVYVDTRVLEEFVHHVEAELRALRPLEADGSGDIGPLVSTEQARIVEEQIADAAQQGGDVRRFGSQIEAPSYVRPTLILRAHHAMRCMREETFGPLLPVVVFSSEDEAVKLANDSSYGLSASVWSRDKRRAKQVASRVHAGAVNVNDVFANIGATMLPQSGWNDSGVGARLGGAAALYKYCRAQAITVGRVDLPVEPHWFPYSKVRLRRVRWGLRVIQRRWRPSL